MNTAYAQFTLLPSGTPVWICKRSVAAVMLQDRIEGQEAQRTAFLLLERASGKGYNVQETPEEVLEALRETGQ